LSISAYVAEDAVEPFEVSIVHEPAHEDARVLAVGARAITVWQLLTERREAKEPA
jgi:hypothetical protein